MDKYKGIPTEDLHYSIREKVRAERMKKFFKIEKSYQFEWGDLMALLTIINVILIITCGLAVAWFGLSVALIGFAYAIIKDRHINNIIMQVAMIVLNIYFITLT